MKRALSLIFGIFVLAILALPLLDPLTRARLFTGIIFGGGLKLALAVVGILLILIGLGTKKWLLKLGVVIALLAIPVAFASHWSSQVALRDSVKEVSPEEELLPQTGLRAPYLVAERQASSNSSGTVGDISGTTYLAGDNSYSTLVERRGIFRPRI